MNEILPFLTTQMDLEGIKLSEISQRKTNTISFHLHVESKNSSITPNKQNKTDKLMDTENKPVV